ncbi:retrovirus-related pol polyprotein from transposon TNT 1-94 [Tanacetum coccineum]
MIVSRKGETVGNQVVQQFRIQCFNYKGFGHFSKECKSAKRVKAYEYHKEKMLLCKKEAAGIQVDSNFILNISDMSTNEGKANLHAEEPKDGRVLLASLIANLKVDVDENKKIQKSMLLACFF